MINDGIIGQSFATMLANVSTKITPQFITGRKNIVIAWGGTNDIATGVSPATVYSEWQSYCSAVHSATPAGLCVIPTMLSRTAVDTQKNTLNNLLLANHAFADAIVDFTGTSLGCDGCSANNTFFVGDGIHPNQNSITTIEAPLINAALNTL